MSTTSVGRNAALMAAGTLTSRILGLVRVALLTAALGAATNVGNAFDTANQLPNVLFIIIAGGVLNAVLVPQLTKAMKNADGGQDYTDRLLTLALTVIGGLTVVAIIAAPLLVALYGSGYTPETARLSVFFTMLCLPQIFFYGLYTLLGQVLTSRESFAAYMWTPVLANVVQIAGILVYLLVYPREPQVSDVTWPMILLLGGSATLGIVVQALALVPPLRRIGFRYRPRWGFRGVGLRSASTVALWSLATIVIAQLGIMANKTVLSHAPHGVAGQAAYSSAFLIFMLPHSLVTVSLLTAMYPSMSRRIHDRNWQAIGVDLRQGLRRTTAAVMPLAALLMVMGPSVAALMFPSQTEGTVRAIGYAVGILAVGLVPYAAIALFQRAYYAFEEGYKPFVIQIVSTMLIGIMAWIVLGLDPQWVLLGIALAQTLSQYGGAAFSSVLIRRRVPGLRLGSLRSFYARLALASVGAALASWLTLQWLAGVNGAPVLRFSTDLGTACGGDGQAACGQVVRVADQWVPVLLTSVEAGLVFLAVLALLVVLLRVDEVLGVVRQLLGRVVR
ncbi:putative peptidoglycan lipid II flippase [Kytococcus aerolatus]|uniref:Putative peptidoglycan lipid II flippase n=1 Tax=Kytococcus aerolatus TaxID=592308 RepID=A0A212TGW3_9MICO|nr:murein biosynthesis integral membrane protein MurJ [Kytococcus aerolatus]SNC65297.1 putative peptidoglycan lipid II flippase [Kytococcus aerolatus]